MQAIAVVTGAARGIGLAIARRLAGDGFLTFAADRDEKGVMAAAAGAASEGLSIKGAALDVTDRAAVRAFFAGLGSVAVLVNNAGVASPMTAFRDLTGPALRHVVAVNAGGTFIASQEAAARMKSGGRIINIASRGYLGGAGAAHYVASKAAVVGLTRAMAVELRWAGINVNAVAPGMVNTAMLADFTPKQHQALAGREPSGGPAEPEAIADVVGFLASPASRFVNGQVIFADGGKSTGMPVL